VKALIHDGHQIVVAVQIQLGNDRFMFFYDIYNQRVRLCAMARAGCLGERDQFVRHAAHSGGDHHGLLFHAGANDIANAANCFCAANGRAAEFHYYHSYFFLSLC